MRDLILVKGKLKRSLKIMSLQSKLRDWHLSLDEFNKDLEHSFAGRL